MLGKWITVDGNEADIFQPIPKLHQFLGTIVKDGKKIETLWDESGRNVEYPEWDLLKQLPAEERR